MKEEWKNITGYNGEYQVSNQGNVKSLKKNNERILKPGLKKKGYLFVNLCMNNKAKSFHVHRLVAKEFISNDDNKPTVNHKDGDVANNKVDNLEWSTYLENNIHSINILHRDSKNSSDSKPVLQFDKEKNLINEYPSMREAQRQTGIVGIDKVCNGIKYRKTAGGYLWKYKDKFNKSVETIEITSK